MATNEKNMKTKIVIWKDGSYKIINDGITDEYENDKDWLTTISIFEELNKTIEIAIKLAREYGLYGDPTELKYTESEILEKLKL